MDFGFTNSEEELAKVERWRDAAIADDWEAKPTYDGHEPIESAAKLWKDGFTAQILTRRKDSKLSKWLFEAKIAIWGPDGLAIEPTYPYSMEDIRSGVRHCNSCGANNVDTQRYSFAGRCCQKCLPAMRAEHEKPGWTK